MAKRRSRITYAPKSRRRSRASDSSQSAVESNVPRIKETDVLPSTSQEKSEIRSANEEHLSPCRNLKSKRTEGKSGRTPKSKQRTNLFHERGKALRDDGTPQRIQDITVTKRTYARWKPLCMSTKTYTKQVLENLILSVLNDFPDSRKKREIQFHFQKISERIAIRLDNIKGPTQRGDYTKMETESHELEDALISCTNQVNALEKELNDQTRLLEQDEEKVKSFRDKKNQQNQPQLHPLLQVEAQNSLNLPSLSNEECNLSTVFQVSSTLQGNGQRLAQALTKLSDQTEKLGFRNWLEAVSETTCVLHDS